MNERSSKRWGNLKRPKPLRPGDAVAVLAPASPLKRGQRAAVDMALSIIENWGLRARMARGIWARHGYLAGSDEHRAEQIRWAFMDEEIRGILSIRGGYGSIRILSRLDRDILQANPKIFVGFSDLTVILVYLLQYGGMVTFHGPTLASPDLCKGTHTLTSRSLFRNIIGGQIPEPIIAESWSGGSVEGSLLGGCLSMITSLLGTPFSPPFDGAILFLEDANEPLYRIDRMLHHLALAGALDRIRGIVLGDMVTHLQKDRLREALLTSLGSRELPILFGVPSGHGEVNLTLPLGTRVRLDADQGTLIFLESGVEEPS